MNTTHTTEIRPCVRTSQALRSSALAIAITMALSSAFITTASSSELATDDNTVESGTSDATPAADAPKSLAEIQVTARKREERQIDVPIGMAVIHGEQLEAAGITNIGDAISTAPGAAAYDAGGGFTYVQVRGASARQGSNETGYYLDDVPFDGVTVPWYPDTRSFDIDSVEVLKGPQGTLFGEGSVGGTVIVNTAKPDATAFGAAVDFSAGSTHGGNLGWGTKAMINVPLIEDRLAMRFVGTNERTSGWLHNNDTGEDEINWQRIKTGRGKLRFTPTDRLTLDLSYWKYKNHSPGGFDYAYQNMTVDTYYDVYSDWDSTSLRARYELDGSDLLYIHSDGGLSRDLNGVNAGRDYVSSIDIGVKTDEVRWGSTGSNLIDWTVGLYQRHGKRVDSYHLEGYDPTHSSHRNTPVSIFGEATWNISERWATSLGARYFREKVDAFDSTATQINELKHTFTHTSPRFSVVYHPQADSSVYATVANGYRSGQLQLINSIIAGNELGIPVPDSTRPDEIWNYEVGYKTVVQDGRLMFEAALFRNIWDDVPIYFPIEGGVFYALMNSGGTSTKGAEMGLTWIPDSHWTVQLSTSYVDAKYREDQPGTNFHKGTPVFNVPKLQFTGGVGYTWPMTGSLNGVARLDASHFSRRETSSTAEGVGGDPITQVSARFGVESMSGWGAYLFGTNLTDDDGAVDPPYRGQATRLRPRTIGIQVSYRY